MELEHAHPVGTHQSTNQHPIHRASHSAETLQTKLSGNIALMVNSVAALHGMVSGRREPRLNSIHSFGIRARYGYNRAHLQQGQFATYVWKSFAANVGITTNHITLHKLNMQWWSTKNNIEAHRLLLQATPIFICWNLWKNRCANKYGGKQSKVSRVKYVVYKDNYKFMTTISLTSNGLRTRGT
ncbi:hypothetical protein H5410_003054 [Solanum commersonii]|uniref:Uncharacterized protein n=1 Tax=Solanum commersonii TaxID=4109 RepID=A0A9J6B3Q6_SOLCO|nr:hypothetical protein H5410_003054 [Solanum commersonii]